MRARRLTTIPPVMSLAEALDTMHLDRVAGRTGGPTTLISRSSARSSFARTALLRPYVGSSPSRWGAAIVLGRPIMATATMNSIRLKPWASELPRGCPTSAIIAGRTSAREPRAIRSELPCRRVWLGVSLLLTLLRLFFGLAGSRLHRSHMAPLGFPRGLHRLARRCGRRANLAAGAGKGRRAGP